MSFWDTVQSCDLEILASEIYQRAGADDAIPTSTVALARKFLGDDAVRVVGRRELHFARAALVPFDRQWRIFVRRDLPANEVGHTVGHELAHYMFRILGIQARDEEAAADRLGAALVAPTRAFLRAVRVLGRSPADLAEAFSATQSSMLLRRGEVLGEPVALKRPDRVYIRGPWTPSPGKVAAWMKYGGPAVASVPITDAPQRHGLVAK